MNITFVPAAWEDYLWFQRHDRKLLKRLNQLIKETSRTPFSGMGKPERLKSNLTGYWSRRINAEHRLVYRITEENLIIVSCRFHYEK